MISRKMASQLRCLDVVSELLGHPLVITGVQEDFYFDGVGHGAHREGRAIDIRCRDLTEANREKLLTYVREWCLCESKVVLCSDPVHIHFEWPA